MCLALCNASCCPNGTFTLPSKPLSLAFSLSLSLVSLLLHSSFFSLFARPSRINKTPARNQKTQRPLYGCWLARGDESPASGCGCSQPQTRSAAAMFPRGAGGAAHKRKHTSTLHLAIIFPQCLLSPVACPVVSSGVVCSFSASFCFQPLLLFASNLCFSLLPTSISFLAPRIRYRTDSHHGNGLQQTGTHFAFTHPSTLHHPPARVECNGTRTSTSIPPFLIPPAPHIGPILPSLNRPSSQPQAHRGSSGHIAALAFDHSPSCPSLPP